MIDDETILNTIELTAIGNYHKLICMIKTFIIHVFLSIPNCGKIFLFTSMQYAYYEATIV
jgi:hypothetical protein